MKFSQIYIITNFQLSLGYNLYQRLIKIVCYTEINLHIFFFRYTLVTSFAPAFHLTLVLSRTSFRSLITMCLIIHTHKELHFQVKLFLTYIIKQTINGYMSFEILITTIIKHFFLWQVSYYFIISYPIWSKLITSPLTFSFVICPNSDILPLLTVYWNMCFFFSFYLVFTRQ
jgi:hypothetical protein